MGGNSPQEVLLEKLMQRSFGARYMFFPDDYRMGAKRQKNRESADLAWVCGDTIILFYMISSVNETPETADEHNFDDARPWIRHWRQEHAELKGSNDLEEFSVPFANVEHLVVLSVVDVPGEGHAWAERVKCDWLPGAYVRASIPESVILRLAELGGSASDLALFLRNVAMRKPRIPEHEALALMQDLAVGSLAHGIRNPKIRTNRDSVLDNRVGGMISGALRHLPKSVVEGHVTDEIPSTMAFNDLDWELGVQLVLLTADVIRRVRDVPLGRRRGYTCTDITVGPYTFIVIVANVRQTMNAVVRAMPMLERLIRARPDFPPTILVFGLVDGSSELKGPGLFSKPQTGKGQTITAETLQQIAYSD